jgi:hypothetical protein
MTHLRPTLAAALAALVLAAPATAADRRTEHALAQERTYTQQATVSSAPARPAPAQDDGSPLTLIAAGVAIALAASGATLLARRHRRDPLGDRLAPR